MDNSVLRVSGLKTSFFTHRGEVKAVNGISFELRRGECLCLVGESGCGKTVTALSILRLIDIPPGRIVDGEIRYGDRDLVKCSSEELRRIRGKEIAMIFQDAQSAFNPVFTVGDQITEELKLHLGVKGKKAREKAITLLQEMEIPSPARAISNYPHQLSGGMRQRAMIAMSLSCDPQILIADEPTTAVDVTIKAQILDMLRELKVKRQMSLLFITHDLGVVSEIGDRAVIVYAGKNVETAKVFEIIKDPQHPYTIGLLNCVPDISKDVDRLISIPGTTPSPILLPAGCPFHPRCNSAMDICSRVEPSQIEVSPDHTVSCHLFN